MQILLSNDDGIHATGIQSLYHTLKEKHKVTAIAPHTERSTTGHSLSLDHPLRFNRYHPKEELYACTGYPADCVLVGIGHHLKDSRPDLVISGINRGANLGQDTYYSGTVAAAREAAFHGISSIAVSLVLDQSSYHNYETASQVIEYLVDSQVHQMIPQFSLININVPNCSYDKVKGIKKTKVGFRHYSEQIDNRIDSRQRSYFWVGGLLEGFMNFNGESDSEAVAEQYVSITPMPLIESVPVDFTSLEQWIHKL